MTVIRRIARPLLAAGFVVGGVNGIRNADKLVGKAKTVTDRLVPLVQQKVPAFPSDEKTLVRINGATQVTAALALATGRAPRLSSAVLAATLVPTTVAGHAFWAETDPTTKKAQQLQFAKNLSMLGGLILAAVDTEGKPGVAWRARRAAKDLKRETKHLRHDASLEAKLAAAKIR